MEGRPWLRILLVFAGFLLLGVPVWSITREKPVPPIVAAEKAAAPAAPLRVTLTFAQPPTSFSLKHLGSILCDGGGGEREFHCNWNTALPSEGADLLLTATWPDGPQTAVRIQVTRDQQTLTDQTVWGQSNLVETITVPGTP